jgi:hypothetical protein
MKKDHCEHPAEFIAEFKKEYYETFGKYMSYCSTCLLEDLNGEHTGGGPTIDAFKSIKRLRSKRS